MKSNDVLHSLYIPDFRVKKDVVPGRYSYLWFQADEATGFPSSPQDVNTGHYLFCTEYCGTDHSNMNRMVYVLNPDAFEAWEEEQARWLDDVPDEDLWAVAGPRLYAKCASCHSVDGSANTGPSWGDPTSGPLAGLGNIWTGPGRFDAGDLGHEGQARPRRPHRRRSLRHARGLHHGLIYNPGELFVAVRPEHAPLQGQIDECGIDATIGMMQNLSDFDSAGHTCDFAVREGGWCRGSEPSAEQQRVLRRGGRSGWPVRTRSRDREWFVDPPSDPPVRPVHRPPSCPEVSDDDHDANTPAGAVAPPVDNYLTLTRVRSLVTLDHKRIGVMYLFAVLVPRGWRLRVPVRTELLTSGRRFPAWTRTPTTSSSPCTRSWCSSIIPSILRARTSCRR